MFRIISKRKENDRQERNLTTTLEELDRIAKILVKRDFELTQIREERETELKELKQKAKDLEETREVLLNILEDAETSRALAIEEKNRTLAIINNLTDGLMVFDRNNNLSFANPGVEEMFGIKKEEVEGKHVAEIKRQTLFSEIIDLIFQKNRFKKIERVEFSLGETETFEITTVLLKGLEEAGCIVIFHDISREKIIERLKSEFVSISAHQLRTPLSAIKWSLSLLREEKVKEEERKDLLDKVYQSNERMIRLINDLLDVTRIEEGRYLYNPKLGDVKEVLEASINPAKEEAKIKNVKFKTLFSKGNIPLVKLDKEKIGVAIQNLAENSVHYTNPGGTIEISVEYHKEKKEIFFKFKDTGIGIPKKQQERVFSRFFRGENVMRMATEGSGLGLFIAKNIIEAHKGKIWFKSTEGKGSTFYFTIPIF